MGFRTNLKAELAYKDMLVKELASLSGVNKRTIDNYLREDGSLPSADAAVSIAEALGITVERLVKGDKKHPERSGLSLSPDVRSILKFIEDLDDRDRQIVFNLVKSLKQMEESEKTKTPGGYAPKGRGKPPG
jgi:transcriptional regulator with XRE-family HTH domain